jgi:hypothetical protein
MDIVSAEEQAIVIRMFVVIKCWLKRIEAGRAEEPGRRIILTLAVETA